MVTRAEGLREKRSTLRVVRAGALNSKRRLQNELNSKANSSTTNGSRELDYQVRETESMFIGWVRHWRAGTDCDILAMRYAKSVIERLASAANWEAGTLGINGSSRMVSLKGGFRLYT